MRSSFPRVQISQTTKKYSGLKVFAVAYFHTQSKKTMEIQEYKESFFFYVFLIYSQLYSLRQV